MKSALFTLATFFILFTFSLVFLPNTAFADHSWGNYHWARTSNPFTIQFGDNVSAAWDPYLRTSLTDWSISSVLDAIAVSGNTNPRRCRPTNGRVEVCNYRYGYNGWLGLAQIWVDGSHITQGVVKLNDTYFRVAKYNTPAWKNLVMCQEIGHTFGLDHQDEDYNNEPLGSCMDYSDDPTPNQHPNQHDYDQLEFIYSHLDEFTSIKTGAQKLPFGKALSAMVQEINFEDQSEWGKKIKDKGKIAVFERDLLMGKKLFTFVILTEK